MRFELGEGIPRGAALAQADRARVPKLIAARSNKNVRRVTGREDIVRFDLVVDTPPVITKTGKYATPLSDTPS